MQLYLPIAEMSLNILLVIGLVHGIFLWYGDILTLYAFCGVFVMLCRNLRIRTLLMLASLLAIVPIFATMGLTAFQWNEPIESQTFRAVQIELETQFDRSNRMSATTPAAAQPAEETSAANTSGPGLQPVDTQAAALKVITFLADEERVYREGGFWEITAHRTIIYFLVGGLMGLSLMLWRSLALMLLGLCLIRMRVFDEPSAYRSLFRRTLLYGFALGIPIELAAEWVRFQYGHIVWGSAVSDCLYHVGSLGHGLGYAAALMLLCQTPAWLNRFKPLAAVGRTALTNYLGQSLMAGLIFYGYGLGLFGRVSYPQASLIALGMMAVQLGVSVLWLRSFRFGPIEWLWRSGTYLKLQPLLKRRGTTVS